MKRLLASLVAIAMISYAHSQAQLISGDGDTVYSSTAYGPGSPTDFEYFGLSGAETNLTNFGVAIASGTGPYTSTDYSNATAPNGSGPFLTAIQYTDTDAGGPVFTFQVTNPLETAFNVYVLTNNANGADDTSVTLSSSGSVSSSTLSPSEAGPVNDYLEFSVTGATTSDIFTASVAGPGNDTPNIGGVTFQDVVSTTSIPEPSTWAMMLGGLGALAFLVRRKSRQSLS
jgi:hypothetical protein